MSGITEPVRASGARPTVVAIGASAGGIGALTAILEALPGSFALPVLIVLHLDPHHRSLLSTVLARRTDLRVLEACDGAVLEPGTVYIAPPDRHLCVSPDHAVRLTHTAPVHYSRPAADELFRSVAEVYGQHALGVICSGNGNDGAAGLGAIHAHGGVTIAQDEASSEFFGMPGTAIRSGVIDYVLPLNQIAGKMLQLADCA